MAARKLEDETRSYVRVTIERTVVQRKDIGVLVDDPAMAGEEVLKMPAAQHGAGWRTADISDPVVHETDHQPGVFDRYVGRLKPAR